MKNYRIFVEKHPEFQVEAKSLLAELNENLSLNLKSLRLLNVYDLFGFTQELLEKCRYSVFGEIVTDSVIDSIDLEGKKYIAVEYLPGQFDQRAASAIDCVHLIDPAANINIKSSKLIIVDDDATEETLGKIRHYCINPVESRTKDLSKLTDAEQAAVKPVPVLEGFRNMSTASEREAYCKKMGLAMNADDLNAVLFEDAGLIKLRAEVKSGLTAEVRKQCVRTLLLDYLSKSLEIERLDVGDISDIGVCHNSCRVRVHKNYLVSQISESLASLCAGVVELARLTYDDRTGADYHYLVDILFFGHILLLTRAFVCTTYICHSAWHTFLPYIITHSATKCKYNIFMGAQYRHRKRAARFSAI